mmetsp:Transcript_36441/g.109456  ORF Transcript_36441/g.109456 Transcript_36441/m.109456 type:complete len:691 (-) Transcript_36441:309-2381(-)
MRPHPFAVLFFLLSTVSSSASSTLASGDGDDNDDAADVVVVGLPPGGRYTRRMTPIEETDISAGGGSHQEEIVADLSPNFERSKRRRRRDRLTLLRGLQSSCDLGSGRFTYVSPAGTDAAGSGSDASSPYATIQYAVDNAEPCETIHVMSGTYYNDKYGSGQNHYKSVVNLSGVSHLTLKAHDMGGAGAAAGDPRPKIKFDGPGGIICNSANPCSHLEISGLEIEGPNKDMSYVEALANRNSLGASLIKYASRGVAVWKGDHIALSDMIVHDCPGSGMRVNKGDYISITDSVVYDNTWWSPRAESAIVLAESLAVDTETDKIKMTLARNEVYGNINKIPYYNPNYDWDYSPIGGYDCGAVDACDPSSPSYSNTLEDCPWQCRYGKSTQNYIIDGMGVYVTRNRDTYLHGQMTLEDNLCAGNGINGVVFHRTDRGTVRRNTVHSNGVVPVLEIPEPAPEEWHASASGKSRQRYSGLVLNNADGVKLWSNTVAARYDDDYAFKQEDDGGAPSPVEAGGNNKACRGLIQMDPYDIVTAVTDLSVCGLSSNEDEDEEDTPVPTHAPTLAPTPTPTDPPAFVEIACGDKCHLIQWPYTMHSSYPPITSLAQCEDACESSGDCRAFSLQYDYAAQNGDEKCFLYRDSEEPSPPKCANDPFNAGGGCSYGTVDGRFYVRPQARDEYNVSDYAGARRR